MGSNAYGLLGLAMRAGAVAPGTEAVRHAVREGAARLVVLAGDASPRQLAKIERTLAGAPVPRARFGDRAALGAAVGVAPISAVAITDGSLADRVRRELGSLVGPGAPRAPEAEVVEETH